MEKVTVLGLGRMGAAMVSRLTDKDWSVTGWTRSSGLDPGAAVAEARYLLLALFDAPACAEVIARLALDESKVVVNTSTVDPGEAAELARIVEKQGATYVHAPVLGSVPAVLGGTLTVIAGGDGARDLLATLGDVVEVAGPEEAAALKLVAAGSLGQALAAIGRSRQHGTDLGLSPDAVLDLLERGPLGNLVRAKRPWFTGDQDSTEFAAGALAKDVALLARHSPVVVPVAEADPRTDIAALAEPRPVDPSVLEPLHAYIAGHETGDPAHFRRAFLPTAHVEGSRDGAFVSWDLDDYCALFTGKPAGDEATRSRRIESLEVSGSVATATMTLRHGPDTFADAFVLLRSEGRWRIANKVYERRSP